MQPEVLDRSKNHVAIIGGGLAGLAAAVALAPRGFQVTLLESRQRLGGRAGSFVEPSTGQLVDACQHVSMGCCTNYKHFCETIGVARYLARQDTLFFMTPDGRVSRFRADPWPAPFHLTRALFSAHYLTPLDKWRISRALGQLLRESPTSDPPFREWLKEHRQPARAVQRYWNIVLTSALNESIDRIGLKYARKVFVDGFMRHRDGFSVEVPRVPLGRLYGEELTGWLERHGVSLRLNAAVTRIEPAAGSSKPAVGKLHLRDGRILEADWYVLAVPFDRVSALLPAVWLADPFFSRIQNLEPSPITSVHFWFDQPVLTLPHVVLIDGVGQWVFSRGEVSPGEHYLQVVVSAAREFRGLGRDEVQRRVHEELKRLFPRVAQARLVRTKVVTEHTATFSAVPGVDELRPTQHTPVSNMMLAGDWTDTGWPATMEGAVRSGYLAAETLLKTMNQPARLVQPDLDTAGSLFEIIAYPFVGRSA